MTDAVTVTVPATSANLGSGFDTLGLALALYDQVEATLDDSSTSVSVTGVGAGQLPGDQRHLVARAAFATFDVLDFTPPGLRLRCRNQIPQARGLGSSAAAIVAGVLAACALHPDGVRRLDDDAVLNVAARIEGHADNVAACLRGGATIAWQREDATFRAARVEPMAALRACVFVPALRSETQRSRALLPPSVPYGDAVHAAGRTALLIAALTGAAPLLFPATEDRLHQPYRQSIMPDSLALVGRLRAAGLPAMISGAGPSVLTLLADPESVGSGEDVTRHAPPGWSVRQLELDRTGARCDPAPR